MASHRRWHGVFVLLMAATMTLPASIIAAAAAAAATTSAASSAESGGRGSDGNPSDAANNVYQILSQLLGKNVGSNFDGHSLKQQFSKQQAQQQQQQLQQRLVAQQQAQVAFAWQSLPADARVKAHYSLLDHNSNIHRQVESLSRAIVALPAMDHTVRRNIVAQVEGLLTTLPLGSVFDQETRYQLGVLRRLVRTGDDLLLEDELQHYRSHLALRNHAAGAKQIAEKSARTAKKARAIADGVGEDEDEDEDEDGGGEDGEDGDGNEMVASSAITVGMMAEAAKVDAVRAQEVADFAEAAWLADEG